MRKRTTDNRERELQKRWNERMIEKREIDIQKERNRALTEFETIIKGCTSYLRAIKRLDQLNMKQNFLSRTFGQPIRSYKVAFSLCLR